MIYAKINPTAKVAINNNPINPTITEMEYMTLFLRGYGIGSKKINIEVNYGNMINNIDGTPFRFDKKFTSNVFLTDNDIATWGTDDSVLLPLIADKLGTQVIEIINLDDN